MRHHAFSPTSKAASYAAVDVVVAAWTVKRCGIYDLFTPPSISWSHLFIHLHTRASIAKSSLLDGTFNFILTILLSLFLSPSLYIFLAKVNKMCQWISYNGQFNLMESQVEENTSTRHTPHNTTLNDSFRSMLTSHSKFSSSDKWNVKKKKKKRKIKWFSVSCLSLSSYEHIYKLSKHTLKSKLPLEYLIYGIEMQKDILDSVCKMNTHTVQWKCRYRLSIGCSWTWPIHLKLSMTQLFSYAFNALARIAQIRYVHSWYGFQTRY